jgi:hypothetical protein
MKPSSGAGQGPLRHFKYMYPEVVVYVGSWLEVRIPETDAKSSFGTSHKIS